jgi:hypothetical protein
MKLANDLDEEFSKNAEAKAPPLPLARPLIDFSETPPDPAKTLLGERFLCVEGGMLFVGPSGIGKTSASVQQDLLWSIGEPAFGIVAARPLKILTIQAEDDDGDLSEIVSGVRAGLHFTPEQCEQSRKNCFYVAEKAHTGHEFLVKVLRPLLEKHRPDIIRLNPLMAYLGGDIKDPAVTSAFLRTGLNPLLAQFQCGLIIVHHTPKTNFRDTSEWRAADWMYAGAGAADITNCARAILIIDPTNDPHIFRFIAAKRASRIGWVDDITEEREHIRHFTHGDHGIYWREASAEEITKAKSKGDKPTKANLMALVPNDGTIAKNLLLARAASANPKIGEKKAGLFD